LWAHPAQAAWRDALAIRNSLPKQSHIAIMSEKPNGSGEQQAAIVRDSTAEY
jgi:hypothetical protein